MTNTKPSITWTCHGASQENSLAACVAGPLPHPAQPADLPLLPTWKSRCSHRSAQAVCGGSRLRSRCCWGSHPRHHAAHPRHRCPCCSLRLMTGARRSGWKIGENHPRCSQRWRDGSALLQVVKDQSQPSAGSCNLVLLDVCEERRGKEVTWRAQVHMCSRCWCFWSLSAPLVVVIKPCFCSLSSTRCVWMRAFPSCSPAVGGACRSTGSGFRGIIMSCNMFRRAHFSTSHSIKVYHRL